jgi:hypothetical protein
VNAKRFAAGGGLSLERAHERRPQAAVAVGGQQGDVDDADLVGPARDIEPPDWLPIEKDEVEARIGNARDSTGTAPQAMYTLRCDTLTIDKLFIVPIGQDGDATEYEAVFT